MTTSEILGQLLAALNVSGPIAADVSRQPQ
jgi:hypothetical protein